MTDNELIAEWLDWKLGEDTLLRWNDCITCGKPTGERFIVFSPETDIELWHGSDGLLAEIEKRDMWDKVLRVLTKQLVVSYIPRGMWDILTTTPAQLTAALVSVIKEE